MIFDIGSKKPREVFLESCKSISDRFSENQFRFVKSSPCMKKSSGDLTFEIWFQSSHFNSKDHSIKIIPHASVLSRQLKKWGNGRPEFLSASGEHSLATDMVCTGLQLGQWNLIATTPDDVVSMICNAVSDIAMPLFLVFEEEKISFENIKNLPRVRPSIRFVQYLLSQGELISAHQFATLLLEAWPSELEHFFTALESKTIPNVNSKTFFAETLASYSREFGWGGLRS